MKWESCATILIVYSNVMGILHHNVDNFSYFMGIMLYNGKRADTRSAPTTNYSPRHEGTNKANPLYALNTIKNGNIAILPPQKKKTSQS